MQQSSVPSAREPTQGSSGQPLVPVLGIMSGTSIDGTDYALCHLNAHEVHLVRHWQVAFPPSLKQRLHQAAAGQTNCHEVGQLHHDLGRFYARGAVQGLAGDPVRAAGLHGQTVFHHPDRRTPATFQLGEAAWLAESLQAPVVSNFRAADLAAGGQGAPLATLLHQVLFAQRGQFRCVQNLGGIANVTVLDWRATAEPRVLAFDTGPANVLLDLAVRRFTQDRLSYDHDGLWAAQGQVAERVLQSWLRHPYFRRPPPKSTGRELFGEPFWETAWRDLQQAGCSQVDALATLTEFTAASLALNYRRHLGGCPELVVLAGGGASNPLLVQRITQRLRTWNPAIVVTTCAQLGWPTQAIEPAAFALLAYYRLERRPANLPVTTGARRPVLLGQIAEP